MTPNQIIKLENMVMKMDVRTLKPDMENLPEWSQVKSDLEALSRSLQAWRHAIEEEVV